MCGLKKEAFKHTRIEIDLNANLIANPDYVPPPRNTTESIEPPPLRFYSKVYNVSHSKWIYPPNFSASPKPWKDTKYIGNECKKIEKIPPGVHVLSVGCTEQCAQSGAQITHLIMFP